jgi:hypothetical protein
MNKSPVTVIVVAPQGAGKSLHAAALASRFGCTSIVDEWDGLSELPTGALALTNVELGDLAGHATPVPPAATPQSEAA